jgi:poly(3-hydroxybutyrate) depolymerase
MYHCSCPANPGALQRLQNQVPGAGCSVLAPGVLASFADSALAANRAAIDDPAQLKRQRVWLMTGERDEVVRPALVEAMADFYRRLGVPERQLHLERVPGAAHGLPVPGAPVACDRTATPYLMRCPGEDAPGQLLAWLYGDIPGAALQPAQPPRAAGLRRFSQRPYRQPGVFDGLDDSGWLYVPAACQGSSAPACRLHVVFHGCAQGQRFTGPGGRPMGRQFVRGAGYNRWAEANRIVVLYPQVLASSAARAGDSYRLNPEGCWDFWGYTDRDGVLAGDQRRFARPDAPQLRAVKAMVDALLRRP